MAPQPHRPFDSLEDKVSDHHKTLYDPEFGHVYRLRDVEMSVKIARWMLVGLTTIAITVAASIVYDMYKNWREGDAGKAQIQILRDISNKLDKGVSQ